MFFTGSHRLLNFKNFKREMISGLLMDFFFYVLPAIMLQGMNNATLAQEDIEFGIGSKFSLLQTTAILLKFANFVDILLEFIMFGIEMYLLHNLGKQGLDRVGLYNEHDRRQRFASTFMCRTIAWLLVTLVGFVIVQFTVEAHYCHARQSLQWYSICTDCKITDCLDCSKSGADKCDECKEGQYFN